MIFSGSHGRFGMRVPKAVLLFILPLVLSKVAQMVLSSKPGKNAVRRIGQPELATEKGVELATDYSKRVASALGVAAIGVQQKLERSPRETAGYGWSTVMQDTAELLLATGALLRVASEFVRDKEKMRHKQLEELSTLTSGR
jgi:hypothetical protein